MKAAGLLVILFLLAPAAHAAEPEPAPVPLKKMPADGQPHHVKCRAGTYWIAIPPDHDASVPTRTFFWCHGSNMNGRSYVTALQELGYGKNDILIGPNGHHRVRDWVYNFNAPSYDTALAYAILDDVGKRYKLGKIYVGGHSQGAYYTFRIVLSKPERFAGAIPFAGGLLLGLDPRSAARRKGKPGPAFAILHGEQDGVVDPELGDWAYEAFLKAEYPCVRYFHPAAFGHGWPGQVKEAITWTLAVTSDDPAELLANATRFLEEDRGGDALICLDRAKSRKGDAASIAELREAVLAKGKEHAETWLERMKADKSGGWAAEMYDFRGAWGTVPTFAPVMKQLGKLRKKHVSQAAKHTRKAWALVKKNKKEEARELFQKVADESFLAFEYARAAQRWLKKN